MYNLEYIFEKYVIFTHKEDKSREDVYFLLFLTKAHNMCIFFCFFLWKWCNFFKKEMDKLCYI